MQEEPQGRNFVSIAVARELRTVPEVVRALGIIDDAWTFSAQLVRLDFAMKEEAALPSEWLEPRFWWEGWDESPFNLGATQGIPRPDVRVSKQSPLLVDLAQAAMIGVGAGGGGAAVWGTFRYLISNAESLGGLPHRLLAGWYRARADEEEQRLRYQEARRRRLEAQVEYQVGKRMEELGRDLREIGPSVAESNVDGDSGVL